MSIHPCTLLAVDDEAHTRIILSYMLSHACPGVRVISCGTIVEALQIFESVPVDCLITDYALGADNGLSLARTVRAMAPDLPILLITGLEYDSITDDALAAGCAAVIAKPVTVEGLRYTIQPLIKGSSAAVSEK